MQQFGKRNGIPPSHPSSSHRLQHYNQQQQADFFSLGAGERRHRRSRSEMSSGFQFQALGSGEKDEAGDDLFNEFMNLEKLETLGGESVENDSEEEAESSGSIQTRTRHCRSLSMDSLVGKQGRSNAFALDLRSGGEFSSAELEKIMANEKLAEMAMADPKRVKRILANRQSAARSKQRKIHYISELERKVQTLQAEATTLSAQLTLLQRDSTGLASQNNELRIRLQSMEQQAHLRDALNEALSAEVHRLKLATAEIGNARSSHSSANKQTSINSQVFQSPEQKKSTEDSMYQTQQQQQANFITKLESS